MTELATVPLPSPELPPDVETDTDYWHGLIDERLAADFLDVTPRKMQQWRQHGDGPPYILLSPRLVKYTRARLKRHADECLRRSTVDPGPNGTG